ncbi:hypothetical protein AB0D08_36930 [Kitasatospora sp. NPDC048540]|uniref:hypothetical protein n=1 Tax=unclassified Kitasatospora TaxID=2633591 RepID=UPI000539D449|nr:hypothetical protein [Kitasatospora sp. MBT63]
MYGLNVKLDQCEQGGTARGVVGHGIRFGNPGDLPIRGVRDGSGSDHTGVHRPADRTFYGTGYDTHLAVHQQQFGGRGDLPLVGDRG